MSTSSTLNQDALIKDIQDLRDDQLLNAILSRHQPNSPVGEQLLLQFKNLAQIMNADVAALARTPHLGEVRLKQLLLIRELLHRTLWNQAQTHTGFQQVSHVRDFLRLSIANKPYEVFVCLYLDAQNQLICCEELFRGSITQSAVYPREVAKAALKHNAAGIICAHNHPSGSAKVSQSDQEITHTLKEALILLDIHLIDHLIVTPTQVVSLAEKGLL